MKNSSSRLAPAELAQVNCFIADRLGLNFSGDRLDSLEKALVKIAQAFNHKSVEACVGWLLSQQLGREELYRIAEFLTVGETYFFRDWSVLESINHRVITEKLSVMNGRHRSLHVWCAGCASGEEPYSQAILLHRLLPDLQWWNLNILATDINTGLLEKARQGVYRNWSFRGVSDELRDGYFTRLGNDHWQIKPEIQKMVSFSSLNLADPDWPGTLRPDGGFDLVLCRNVLMYFTVEKVESVACQLIQNLGDKGYLLLSPSESHLLKHKGVTPCSSGGPGIFRKDTERNRTPEKASPHPVTTRSPERVETSKPQNIQSTPTIPESKDNEVQCRAGSFDKGMERNPVKVSRQEENEVSTLFLEAKRLADKGLMDQAIEACRRILELQKTNPRLHYFYATILQETGDQDQAIATLQKVLFLDPDFIAAHFALGNLLLRQGRRNQAGRSFKNALEIMKNLADDHILPDVEGLTAGHLRAIINHTIASWE